MSILLQVPLSIDDIVGFTELVSRKFYSDTYGIPQSEVNVDFYRWDKKDFQNGNGGIRASFPSNYHHSEALPRTNDVLQEAALLRELIDNPRDFNSNPREINEMILNKSAFANVFKVSGQKYSSRPQIRTNVFQATGLSRAIDGQPEYHGVFAPRFSPRAFSEFIVHSSLLESGTCEIGSGNYVPADELFTQFLTYRDTQFQELQRRSAPGRGKFPANYRS